MDKKQRISWGVGLGSLALVTGIVSYIGLSNDFKTNNQIENTQFNQKADGTFDNGSSKSQDRIWRLSRYHGAFDTTTGGT